jgi:hypothetical protein
MRAKILNRAGEVPSDGWYQIEVSGTHPAGKARKQVIDAIALESIVNRFAQEKAAAGENFAGLLTDADHLSHDMANSTEALAWAQELAIRDGQLHARLDLTDIGEAAIRNKRYKFFSTEYDPEDYEDLGGGRVRPLRLSGLAFTNRPNNRGARPISNREKDHAGGTPALLSNREGGEQTETETKPTMQPIALKLGLPADADEAAILKKLTDVMSELETLKGKTAETEAEVIMNRYGERIPKEKREDVKKRLIRNREDTVAMLELLPEPAKKAEERIFNRGTAKQPDTISDEGDKAGAEKKAAAIRNRAHTISREEKIPFNQAFSRAQAEQS